MRNFSLTIILVTICLLIISSSVQAKNNVIHWEANHLESILGDELTETITTSFTSTEELTDIRLWIVPELQPYVTVEPQSFDLIETGVPYEVTITTSIPRTTFPDIFDGTIHVRKGKKTIPETLKLSVEVFYEGVLIPPTTKVIDGETTQYLDCDSIEENVLTFEEITDELYELDPNDVLIFEPTECMPYGFIGRIKEIVINQGVMTIYTEPANLEDAIEEGSIDFSYTYSSEEIAQLISDDSSLKLASSAPKEFANIEIEIDEVLYDMDGNEFTTNDQVRATGTFSVAPSFDISAKIKWFKLTRAKFTGGITESANLNIISDIDLSVFPEEYKRHKMFQKNLHTFVIMVGPLPVTITPVLTVYVGIDGSVTAGLSTSIQQSLTAEAGIEYKNGEFTPIKEFDWDFDYSTPSVSAGFNVEAYVGPQLSIMIYTVAGPYAEVDASLELDTGYDSGWWWDLYAGIDALAGLKGEILGYNLFDVNLNVYSNQWLLASSDTGGGNDGDILIINPDHHRILKCGVVRSDTTYLSVATGSNADGALGLQDYPGQWSGVGVQSDFIGSVLETSGYQVDYYEASAMPSISPADYGIVIVQDPLRTNVMQFDKATVDAGNLPDLLEYTTDASFLTKLNSYIQSGGNVVLVGDAVRLLENGTNRLNYGKTIETVSPSNIVDQPSSWIPGQWLFTRGNPFCGRDRNGSGQYTVASGELMVASTILANVSINNRSDLPYSHTWSDTVYKPSDATSLLGVNFAGQGEYVLNGSICNPTVYYDTVNETVNGFIGYTEYGGRKIYYLGSDCFFDYNFKDWHGTWHTGQSMEINNTVESGGKNTVISLLDYIFE